MSFTVRPVRQEKKSSATLRKYMVLGAGLLEAAVHLWHRMRQRNDEEVKEEKRTQLLKRIVMILLSILLIAMLLIGTLHLLVRVKALSLGGIASMAGTAPGKDKSGFTNILLLGEGNSDHDGIDLTDTLMVASLDPASRSAVLLSLPRDLYVLSTEKMGKGRINSLYRDYKSALIYRGTEKSAASGEALTQLAKELSLLLELDIHGVIKLNFSGFTEGIDLLGGIDVVVPTDLVDTEYPGPNYTYETFEVAKGTQHLDGATALKYARSRHSTSDFSRSARQQQIISAAVEKAKQSGLLGNAGKISDMISIVAKNMETTFTSRELLGLLAFGKTIDQQNVFSMQLSDQNGLFDGLTGEGGFLYAPPREQFDGAAVLLPVSIPEFPVTWKQIRSLVKVLTQQREALLRKPSIVIANAGAREGSARALGGELIRYGFNVTRTRNFAKPNPDLEKSWIAVRPSTDDTQIAKRALPTLTLLQTMLGITQNSAPDLAVFQEDQPDILIVLGEDYRYTPLQNLVR